MQTRIIHSFLSVGLVICFARQTFAEGTEPSKWLSFRNGGASRVTGDFPTSWAPDDAILWQQELNGYGQSTPVIYGHKVFVSTVIGPMKETCCVSCWDLQSGTSLWAHEFEAATESASNYMHSRAAPTPVVDADGVYVFFEGGDLVALNHEGEVQWHRDLAADLGPFTNNHGLGSSPSQTDELVIISLEHQGPSYLLAIEKSSGRTRWKVDRPSGSSWSSPIVVTSQNGPRVIVSSAGSVTAYEASSGQVLWTLEGLEGNTVPSPTSQGDHLLIGARLPEFGESSAAAKSNLCLRLTDDSYDVEWRAETVLSDYASPVVADGCAYFLNKAGVLTCLDLNSGERHYTKRLGCSCWATPMVAGDHIYFFGKNGETHVIRSGPEFERVAVSQLWSADNPPKPETYVESTGSGHGHQQSSENEAENPSDVAQTSEAGQQPRGLLAMLLAGDKNGDGVLTKDEVPPRFQRMAKGGDLNDDDQLDEAEMKAMDESFRERRAGSREGARDPIVYGVAAADGVIVIRTGTRLFAVSRDATSNHADTAGGG
ncbi:MAG: PQQ-binding-like beta-propeller repeat protein [Planctomycetaceae bacterium]|nr:PQQ-binding-like beta-propeller repeat protein [Planctomycetaceae bacterium]